VVRDLLQLLRTGLHSHSLLAAENLFLRKQLALYIERGTKPRRASNATRMTFCKKTGCGQNFCGAQVSGFAAIGRKSGLILKT
jgi:hypothetical protein